MFYYKVTSSHWAGVLEFKSNIELKIGQCFKILSHDGNKRYPTRFKVVDVSSVPEFAGKIVNILSVDTNVDYF